MVFGEITCLPGQPWHCLSEKHGVLTGTGAYLKDRAAIAQLDLEYLQNRLSVSSGCRRVRLTHHASLRNTL